MRALTLALLLLTATPAAAVELGQWVEVTATHDAGVPVHREARSSMFARVPTGTTGEVLEIREHWLRVQFPDLEGWVTQTYVTREYDPPTLCAYIAEPGGPTIAAGWAAVQGGGVLCLAAGAYAEPIAPPEGLAADVDVTVRALGEVTVTGIALVGNRRLWIEPVRVCEADYCAVWSRAR